MGRTCPLVCRTAVAGLALRGAERRAGTRRLGRVVCDGGRDRSRAVDPVAVPGVAGVRRAGAGLVAARMCRRPWGIGRLVSMGCLGARGLARDVDVRLCAGCERAGRARSDRRHGSHRVVVARVGAPLVGVVRFGWYWQAVGQSGRAPLPVVARLGVCSGVGLGCLAVVARLRWVVGLVRRCLVARLGVCSGVGLGCPAVVARLPWVVDPVRPHVPAQFGARLVGVVRLGRSRWVTGPPGWSPLSAVVRLGWCPVGVVRLGRRR